MITLIDSTITSITPIKDAELELNVKFNTKITMFGEEYAACQIKSRISDIKNELTLYIMTKKDILLLADDTPAFIAFIDDAYVQDPLAISFFGMYQNELVSSDNCMHLYDEFYIKLSDAVQVFNHMCEDGFVVQFHKWNQMLAEAVEYDPAMYTNIDNMPDTLFNSSWSKYACLVYARLLIS